MNEDELYRRRLRQLVDQDRNLRELAQSWQRLDPRSEAWKNVDTQLEAIRQETRAFVATYGGKFETFERCPAARDAWERQAMRKKSAARRAQEDF